MCLFCPSILPCSVVRPTCRCAQMPPRSAGFGDWGLGKHQGRIFLPEHPSWGLGWSTGPGMAPLGTSERDGGEREPRDWPGFGAEGKELAEAVLGCRNGEDAGFLRWKWDKAAATTWG